MKYDITRPWKTLDPWQKEYIYSNPNDDCFLLCGRQVGKTTAMSIKAVELCVNHFRKGEFILICSITEKQAYHMLAKALAYAEVRYSYKIDRSKKNKPTMHRLMFRNGTGILCYAAGDTGEGLRGYTIKKLMIDEGSRMGEEFFVAVQPMISVIKGSMDIASTPYGKLNSDGSKKFFYKCSMDGKFKKFYVSAEDCPRHTSEFLQQQKESMTKLAYAQEYQAVFTDELKRFFDDALIEACCILEREEQYKGRFYLGVDIAGFGKDECTYEVFQKLENDLLIQKENIIEKRNLTTDTTQRIITLNKSYKDIKKIGVDDGGVGFGVFSELLNVDDTKKKTVALNNSSRNVDSKGHKSKKLLKEDMYLNLLSLMENGKIKMFKDDELIESLRSIQMDGNKIFGSYTHITEGIIRAAWLAVKDKSLNIFIRTF